MSGVAMTGANGFLGFHTRAALRDTDTDVAAVGVGEGFDKTRARAAVDGASRLMHIAGVNRANDEDVRDGNIAFAEQLAATLRAVAEPPATVVYANSSQAENGTVYGEAKARAADILRAAVEEVGGRFVDLRLPNLFGEHGRPFYNAVTATFSHLLAAGQEPSVENDKDLTLLHAQNAADLITGAAEPDRLTRLTVDESVSGLLARLRRISDVYRDGEIPDIAEPFNRDLFNTYRSYVIESHTPIRLARHADARGSFFEIIRSHGGCGQSSFSTTVPGVSRGDHFHRRKVERFTVLSGRATISLRRMFTREVLDFEVSGDEPVAIDMPTMWSHKIRNTGDELLFTSFWTDDIFDPEHPDTIPEAV